MMVGAERISLVAEAVMRKPKNEPVVPSGATIRLMDEVRREVLRLKPATETLLARHAPEGAERRRLEDPPVPGEADSDAARAAFAERLRAHIETSQRKADEALARRLAQTSAALDLNVKLATQVQALQERQKGAPPLQPGE